MIQDENLVLIQYRCRHWSMWKLSESEPKSRWTFLWSMWQPATCKFPTKLFQPHAPVSNPTKSLLHPYLVNCREKVYSPQNTILVPAYTRAFRKFFSRFWMLIVNAISVRNHFEMINLLIPCPELSSKFPTLGKLAQTCILYVDSILC